MIVLVEILTLILQLCVLYIVISGFKKNKSTKGIICTTQTFDGYAEDFDIDIFIQRLMDD